MKSRSFLSENLTLKRLNMYLYSHFLDLSINPSISAFVDVHVCCINSVAVSWLAPDCLWCGCSGSAVGQHPLGEVQLTVRHSSQRNKLIVVVHACRWGPQLPSSTECKIVFCCEVARGLFHFCPGFLAQVSSHCDLWAQILQYADRLASVWKYAARLRTSTQH